MACLNEGLPGSQLCPWVGTCSPSPNLGQPHSCHACLSDGRVFSQSADSPHAQAPVCRYNPIYSLFWKILPAELAGEQLLEKPRHTTRFFSSRALCLNSDYLVTQLAGKLPEASSEQRLSAVATCGCQLEVRTGMQAHLQLL